MIKVEIIKDSISTSGARITTFLLTYPRFIHSEFMTHRMISKNASSSRAIPTERFIKDITENPAMPIAFSKNCKGMQSKEEILDQTGAAATWLEARDAMLKYAQILASYGVHKQHANRILEPFQHITVVATATDWDNFFALRCHKDAQPEFQALAKLMWSQYSTNEPEELEDSDWHLPFVTELERGRVKSKLVIEGDTSEYRREMAKLLKRSAARCARTSYNTPDGLESPLERDLELYDRLAKSSPAHLSPLEHQAMALANPSHRSGNLTGWLQYRKTITNENIIKYSGPEN